MRFESACVRIQSGCLFGILFSMVAMTLTPMEATQVSIVAVTAMTASMTAVMAMTLMAIASMTTAMASMTWLTAGTLLRRPVAAPCGGALLR